MLWGYVNTHLIWSIYFSVHENLLKLVSVIRMISISLRKYCPCNRSQCKVLACQIWGFIYFLFLYNCIFDLWTVVLRIWAIWRHHIKGIFELMKIVCICTHTLVFTQISCSSVDNNLLSLSAQTASAAHGQYEWWYLSGCVSHSVTACGAYSLATQLWARAAQYQMVVALSVHGGAMCHLASCPVMPCIIPRRRTRYPHGHPYPSPMSLIPPLCPLCLLVLVFALHPSTGRRTGRLIRGTARTA